MKNEKQEVLALLDVWNLSPQSEVLCFFASGSIYMTTTNVKCFVLITALNKPEDNLHIHIHDT